MKKLVIILFINLLFSFSFLGDRITIASYYGKEHHGKKTASKERFNMYDFTAAHRTLEFNTKVRITNIDNDKSVIVRINDRGPFIKSRDLDISYAAFKEIADIRKGKIKVKYEILN